MPHSIYNITVVFALIIAYATLLIDLAIKARKSNNQALMSKIQRQTLAQCTVICTATFIAALIYVIVFQL